MSPQLRKFLTDWLEWAESPTLDNRFKRRHGLCDSLYYHYHFNDRLVKKRVQLELNKLFLTSGLCRSYPFGYRDFADRYADRTMHKCPKRLAWVRKVLSDD